ncbi:HNH endonuclease signature motif containing protein [Gulosibacter sp. ACHW.36C]|uniref:HNH endonuclease n=1 Tax=Gulosibacter sediminis TaxID=1729695 RepID=A0ABY4MXD4_9MICO|nr:HNH endonuclease signature motif containing protein [Gulosibacter sediminis]UQN14380.1 HNH endonuclease [Gulosibacter sediminis]
MDHITPWAAGGKTSVDNQAHLCRQHHILKHQRPWRYRHLGNGISELESPHGEVRAHRLFRAYDELQAYPAVIPRQARRCCG